MDNNFASVYSIQFFVFALNLILLSFKVEYQGWAIALFEKERIPLFLLKRAKKRAKERIALFALFVKSERVIYSLLLFLKEQKSDLLFVALLVKSKRANGSLLLFL